MKKTDRLFKIWGVLVVMIIGLLTTLGFMLKNMNKEYLTLEEKLQVSAEKYTSDKFMYPDEGQTIRVTKKELIGANYLDELKKGKDYCDGYVEVKTEKIVKYKSYIKCNNYETDGYENKKD